MNFYNNYICFISTTTTTNSLEKCKNDMIILRSIKMQFKKQQNTRKKELDN